MSLEPGGRSAKYGDEYENRYLAKLLLRLVNEHLYSIIVEPVGENSDSIEFITENSAGITEYYQCKASNGTHSKWSVADLQRYDVITRAKVLLSGDSNSHYYFISPLPYSELDELCKRARTTSSAKDLIDYQLTNTDIRHTFTACAETLNLDISSPEGQVATVSFLSRCYFELYADGVEAVRDLEEQISLIFTGKAAEVRVLLEQYANATGKYGIKITAKDVIEHLESFGIHIRNFNYDERILPRINTLNEIYWDRCPAINGQLIHREATSQIIQKIQAGSSVILHGKAGSGKSGCLQETIDYLSRERVLYLAIKLDKHPPEKSADAFGRILELPESPVHCLAALASGAPCVLILDQLDALRWTSGHSATALSVCKELIAQANAINKHSKGKVSIIFASRTFDLENDSGLKNLFHNNDSNDSVRWEKINVDIFTQAEVVKFIGEAYYTFSSRLQRLLLTPSSLYVWTQLDKNGKENSISTVHQLMSTWWQQILEKSEMSKASQEEILTCRDLIVTRMEQNAVFSLPCTLFPDHQKALTFLASCGMLRNDGKNISFVHQSFLDYFITSDILSKIYDGCSIVDLISPYEEQIPQIRFQLLSVLQNLIEANQNLFVEQSRDIIESDHVHYYFKCSVFEVIGQCEAPNKAVLSFVDQYSTQADWRAYIIQVVYYGHTVFVKHLNDCKGHNWLEDTNLSLLKSINRNAPDFVVNMLRSYEIHGIADARKIYWGLCYDVADDSEEIFQFRIDLLQQYPALLDDFWGFTDLYTRHPMRAIRLLEIILKNSDNYKYHHIYFGDDKQIQAYATKNYKAVAENLFPVICEVTNGFLIYWPFYKLSADEKYHDWIAGDFEKPVLRTIVDLTKVALEVYALNEPDEACSFIKQVPFPLSAVSHELVVHTMTSLPEAYSDFVIEKFLVDFRKNVFVFTADQDDYLSYAKQLIKKFSPLCSLELFRQLEYTVCDWKNSVEEMCNTYRHRMQANRTKQYEPVYYSYWGHMQKELLPYFDSSRLSKYALELIQVLQRNPWVHIPHFYSGYKIGMAKSVISPVAGYTERISDNRWLKIISTPNEKMSNRWRGDDSGPNYVEATHWTFSSSLGGQAKRQPSRFAKLSLSFPEDCYSGYISEVLYALGGSNESESPVDLELTCQVIRRFAEKSDHNIAIAIARIVEHRASEIWADDILALIGQLATAHPNPSADEYNVTNSSGPEHLTVRSLHDNEINCVRGCALHAIAALLWEHPSLGEYFEPVITMASKDENPAVRFAVLFCLLPFFNIDSAFSIEILKYLLNFDLRIVGAHGFWEIMSRDYMNDPDYYHKKLMAACRSDIEDLSKTAAGILCALAIFQDDALSLEAIIAFDFSVEQQNELCTQAVSSFKYSEYYARSEKILSYLIDNASESLHGFNQLFYQECISIQRDEAFLISLMQSKHSHEVLHPFLLYLKKSDDDICCFAEVIKAIGKSMAEAPFDWRGRLDIQDLVQCVIRLSDRGKDDPTIQSICLEIWDDLFRSNLQDIKPLADMIDNFE